MTLAKAAPDTNSIERVLIEGDLRGLSTEQRVTYYHRVCESVGLNPLTQPFEYLTLQGKTILYARRACTDQLRKIHRVSVAIVAREKVDDIYVVTARATTPDGRCDESIGAVPLGALKGEALSNALMKAETKAKRRVTLAICGLSMLDETEVASVEATSKPAPQRRTLDDVAQQPPAKALPAPRDPLEEPPPPCPVFQSGKHSGQRYDEVPVGMLRALLAREDWVTRASEQQLAWATHIVAKHAAAKVFDAATGEVMEPGAGDEP